LATFLQNVFAFYSAYHKAGVLAVAQKGNLTAENAKGVRQRQASKRPPHRRGKLLTLFRYIITCPVLNVL